MKCILCNPETVIEQEVVLKSEYNMFLQTPQEILKGSGLIVPIKHRSTPFELTKEEWDDLFQMLHDVKKLLDEKYNPDGYNIGWNCGEVGGQHLSHVHLHVIPRFKDEPLSGRGIRSHLKSEDNRRLNYEKVE